MPKFTISRKINAPQEEVFAVFSDIGKIEQRIPGIKAMEMLSDGPVGVGTRWRETRTFGKRDATEEMWITEFNPPHQYVVEAESHGTHYKSTYFFTALEQETKVDLEFAAKPLSFMAKIMSLFAVLFMGMAKRCMAEDMDALAAILEGQDSPIQEEK